jgi:hypothetical protein
VFTAAVTGVQIHGTPTPRPCSFCGFTKPDIYLQFENPPLYVGVCSSCGPEGPAGESEIEAAEVWNRRA